MANTITFEISESEQRKFEELLDETLKVLRRMEKESPERDARFDRRHEEFMQNISETEKMMKQTSRRLAKWKIPLEK